MLESGLIENSVTSREGPVSPTSLIQQVRVLKQRGIFGTSTLPALNDDSAFVRAVCDLLP